MKSTNIEIEQNPDYSLVCPNMIYNRPDLQSNNHEYYLIHAMHYDNEYYIPYSLGIDDKGNPCAELGVWLSLIPSKVLLECAKLIFAKHHEITRVRYKNCLDKAGYWHQGNHFSIQLTSTYDELLHRLSSKGRNTIKRKKEY